MVAKTHTNYKTCQVLKTLQVAIKLYYRQIKGIKPHPSADGLNPLIGIDPRVEVSCL